MTVLLKDVAPPIREVSALGYAAVAVYGLLFESAHRERNFSRSMNGQFQVTGGTTYWSHKAIAQTLKLGKATVLKAADALLDNGYIQVIGYIRLSKGSPQRVYRVIHPMHIVDQRKALEILGGRPSDRQKAKDEYAKKGKTSLAETGVLDSCDDGLVLCPEDA
jgi:hypothetical protein